MLGCCAAVDLKSRWKLLLPAKPGGLRGTRCFLHGLYLLSAEFLLQFAVLDFFLREARIVQRPQRQSPAYWVTPLEHILECKGENANYFKML